MIKVTRDENISRLAWAARIAPNEPVTAIVGPWVEYGKNFIFEGCWNGDFAATDIANSFSFMGSGILVDDDETTIVAPCNTTEAVYTVRGDQDQLWVSNSIPLLLKVSDAQLDPTYLDYEAAFLSIAKGLKEYQRAVPIIHPNGSSGELEIHYYCNLTVGRNGVLQRCTKPDCPPISSFSEYEEFLHNETAGLVQNAADERRIHRYSPLVFCSTGYDSSLCAVVGADAGCDHAVCFESKKTGAADSGEKIVRSLGYETIHVKKEREYFDHPTAELFVATGELGTSAFFAAATDELTGTMLLSGIHGDQIWDRNGFATNPNLVRSSYPDTAKKEFRLATGYLNVPIAFLAVSQHHNIIQISNSEEMKPWQLDNDYDRPIPRRIIETAGVDRESFGWRKAGGAGSSMRFGTLNMLKRSMPPENHEEFRIFLSENQLKRKLDPRWIFRAIAYLTFMTITYMGLRGITFPGDITRVDDWDQRLKCSPFAPSYLFQWGVDKVTKERYATATLPTGT